ncbi:hypothetical protein [Pseudoalteromonas sp. MMG005]|uniref:hypothetical protein n=1 Tax=Pseudoalteromonas sp. MMG005 TaxID=2822682 RepID=UPI001B3A6BF1|nr:hypothetical protein [Pseudoalteromonas sp. MMG005]MBQ4848233.1 hypothetical protein [Pseudoalteromonas sp. MMG005]
MSVRHDDCTVWFGGSNLDRKGVYITGRFYPDYDYSKQFYSALGVTGSPTEKRTPRMSNYPLAVLFAYLVAISQVLGSW